MKKPFRLEIEGQCCRPLEVLISQAKTCDGLERIQPQSPHGRKLAIVGGGYSTLKRIEELKNWDGDIWAVNNTGSWLLKYGIKSIFTSVDPGDISLYVTDGMEDALIATCCNPELRERFRNVRLFDLIETHSDGMAGGTTTATRLPSVAIKLGYVDISFFGCEGSFELGKDHVDRNDSDLEMIVIRAGDKDYFTLLGYVNQCEVIAGLVNLAPSVFKNRSGGLLQGFIDYPDSWEVVAVSGYVKNHLEKINGKIGMFERKYNVNAAS